MKTAIIHLAVTGLLVLSQQAFAVEVASTPERDRQIRIKQVNQELAAKQKARAQLIKKSALLQKYALAKQKRQRRVRELLQRNRIRQEKLAKGRWEKAVLANKRQQRLALVKRNALLRSNNAASASAIMAAKMSMRAAAKAR